VAKINGRPFEIEAYEDFTHNAPRRIDAERSCHPIHIPEADLAYSPARDLVQISK
jgi:hypothetical protein